MFTWFSAHRSALLAIGLVLTTSAYAQTGSGGSNGSIDKCDKILGTLAVAEPQDHILASLGRYQLGSPSTMLRMIAQESGCFTVVERGVAMRNIQQERELAGAGMMQQGSNMGGGQLQAADFVMTPSVQFSDSTGGIGAAVGGLLGRFGGPLSALGGLAGGLKFKEAETTLLVSDVRSGIQVASAEGKASKMDFSLGGWGWGGFGWAAAGGYSKTPEGKLIAASLLDNYNRIVATVRNRPALIQSTSQASQNNAAASIQATPMAGAAVAAVQAPVSTSNSNFPAALMGNYVGNFTGGDEGNFNAVVGSNGVISGSGYSTKYRINFITSGLVTAQGMMSMTGSGSAGSATFVGNIDRNSGTVQGQWQILSSNASAPSQGGTFVGQRR